MHAFSFLAVAAAKAGKLDTFVAAIPHLLGMLVVMISLTILWGVCALTAHLIKTFAPAATATAPPVRKQAPAAPVAAGSAALSPELVVVVAAAVNSVLGMDYKVVAIRPQDSNWEKAGRQSVLSSHRLR